MSSIDKIELRSSSLTGTTKLYASFPKRICDTIGYRKGRFFEMPSRWQSINYRKGESMMYDWIGDAKRIRSLRSAQLGGHGRIAVVEDTPVGSDAIRQ